MEILLGAALLGIIVGAIAKRKGRSFWLWWLYGAALFIVAIIHVLLIPTTTKKKEDRALSAGGKKCPQCAEVVKLDARVCRFCNYSFVTPPLPNS